jgi:hypothetical protein
MMHQNFFHWHSRAEIKPETASLEPRWAAAGGVAEAASRDDLCHLLRLVLFTGPETAFSKRLTNSLLKAEPTFPIEKNTELLRVMAAAALHSTMDLPSEAADAIALGLRLGDLFPKRTVPVCEDILIRAGEYLSIESEAMRPAGFGGALDEAESEIEGHFATLKKAAVATTVPAELGKAVEAFGRAIVAAMKNSHGQVDKVNARLAEESQFLWWLIGHRSTELDRRREKLSIEDYSLHVASEGASRVRLLPPPASVESLLEEALDQCRGAKRSTTKLVDFIMAVDTSRLSLPVQALVVPELTPCGALLAERKRTGDVPGPEIFKQLRILPGATISPVQLAKQYFRELIFLRAIVEVK